MFLPRKGAPAPSKLCWPHLQEGRQGPLLGPLRRLCLALRRTAVHSMLVNNSGRGLGTSSAPGLLCTLRRITLSAQKWHGRLAHHTNVGLRAQKPSTLPRPHMSHRWCGRDSARAVWPTILCSQSAPEDSVFVQFGHKVNVPMEWGQVCSQANPHGGLMRCKLQAQGSEGAKEAVPHGACRVGQASREKGSGRAGKLWSQAAGVVI